MDDPASDCAHLGCDIQFLFQSPLGEYLAIEMLWSPFTTSPDWSNTTRSRVAESQLLTTSKCCWRPSLRGQSRTLKCLTMGKMFAECGKRCIVIRISYISEHHWWLAKLSDELCRILSLQKHGVVCPIKRNKFACSRAKRIKQSMDPMMWSWMWHSPPLMWVMLKQMSQLFFRMSVLKILSLLQMFLAGSLLWINRWIVQETYGWINPKFICWF